MRKRQFRPTLDGTLEDRIAPAGGHKAVVLTTNSYANAVGAINLSVDEFNSRDNLSTQVPILDLRLQVISRSIPYGLKSLYPGLSRTTSAYLLAGREEELKPALNRVLQDYVRKAIKDGFIKYLQSNIKHLTDGDIRTSGKVPRGSGK